MPNIGPQDEKGLRRHISVVMSPNENGILGLATRMRNTAFKRTLADLETGSEVDIEPPKGKLLLPHE